jgi:hypothetical protein
MFFILTCQELSNVVIFPQMFKSGSAKSGSFGIAEGLALCVGAKPNVPLVRLAKIVFKKCGSAKKIKHEALGCRVGKKSAVKFICCPNVSIIVCQFNGCCVVLYACL